MKNFALIGAAGYIAPRHLKAIKAVGGNLVAAYDVTDSVGILDSYFPDCYFFTDEFEFYDRLIEGLKINYMVICSPNFLHEEHCRNAIKLGVDIICEKPLVLTLQELENLIELEQLTGRAIYTILQLRHHPLLLELKEKIDNDHSSGIHDVRIEYFTPRGRWYHESWKGNQNKSGGIATNIGIHLFDLAWWIFGNIKSMSVEHNSETESVGLIELDKAHVHWHLSIKQDVTPKRQITIDNKSYEFTEGFSDLHTTAYEAILNNKGFTTEDVKPSIDIVERIRNS